MTGAKATWGSDDIKEWLAEQAIANPDLDYVQPVLEEEIEFEPRPWHDLYFAAFDALRCDRFYGAMGGEGPIYYTALSRYASDNRITGTDLWLFNIFMNAVDGEWLAIRAEEDKRRQQQTGKS